MQPPSAAITAGQQRKVRAACTAATSPDGPHNACAKTLSASTVFCRAASYPLSRASPAEILTAIAMPILNIAQRYFPPPCRVHYILSPVAIGAGGLSACARVVPVCASLCAAGVRYVVRCARVVCGGGGGGGGAYSGTRIPPTQKSIHAKASARTANRLLYWYAHVISCSVFAVYAVSCPYASCYTQYFLSACQRLHSTIAVR